MPETPNPYSAPAHEADDEEVVASPGVALFTPKQVGVASFFGSAMAGGLMLAINDWRQGRSQRGLVIVAVAAVVLALTVVVANWIPSLPSAGFAAGLTGATYSAALSLRGKPEPAPPGASTGSAFGVGALGLVVGLSVVFGTLFALEGGRLFGLPDSIDRGHGQIVRYDSEVVPVKEAMKLADFLEDTGYFDGVHAAAVDLDKKGDIYELCLFVADRSWEDRSQVEAFRDFAAKVEREAFSRGKVKAAMCNADGERKKELL